MLLARARSGNDRRGEPQACGFAESTIEVADGTHLAAEAHLAADYEVCWGWCVGGRRDDGEA